MTASPAMRVLFVGNSFTARNDVPALIAALAAARGRRLDHRLISAGGASLRAHWNKGDAQRAIATEHYDVVVLQEQSTLPVKNAARMHENIRLFDDVIRAAGATTALYLTWARLHEPHNQSVIAGAYRTIGTELGATVVPVGVAWEQFRRKHTVPVLHDKDRSHSTLAGSYLAACVFLAVLFKENPVGAATEVGGLSAADILRLQKAGWAAARP